MFKKLKEQANSWRKKGGLKKDLELPVPGVMMLITSSKPQHILPQIDPNIKDKNVKLATLLAINATPCSICK